MEAEPKPDFAAIAKTTHFSKSELRRLHRRFLAIADAEKQTVDKETFLSQPEVCHCCVMPLAVEHALRQSADSAAAAAAAADPAGLGFEDYVRLLSKFSVKATLAEKNEYLFSILDSDGDDKLQADDLRRFYEAMLGGRYTTDALQQLTKRVWRTICPRDRQFILRQEFFTRCLNATELQFAMTIHY